MPMLLTLVVFCASVLVALPSQASPIDPVTEAQFEDRFYPPGEENSTPLVRHSENYEFVCQIKDVPVVGSGFQFSQIFNSIWLDEDFASSPSLKERTRIAGAYDQVWVDELSKIYSQRIVGQELMLTSARKVPGARCPCVEFYFKMDPDAKRANFKAIIEAMGSQRNLKVQALLAKSKGSKKVWTDIATSICEANEIH